MAFIVTALYALALFSAGVIFVRRGKKEKTEKEDHCSTPGWNGTERRCEERRSGIDRRRVAPILTR